MVKTTSTNTPIITTLLDANLGILREIGNQFIADYIYVVCLELNLSRPQAGPVFVGHSISCHFMKHTISRTSSFYPLLVGQEPYSTCLRCTEFTYLR